MKLLYDSAAALLRTAMNEKHDVFLSKILNRNVRYFLTLS